MEIRLFDADRGEACLHPLYILRIIDFPECLSLAVHLDTEDGYAGFQKPQLFQPFETLETPRAQFRIAAERIRPVSIDTDMMKNRCRFIGQVMTSYISRRNLL